jgi:hypothetical protein
MLDIFLEPEADVYCPICDQEAYLKRGRIHCLACAEDQDLYFYEEVCHVG